MAKEKDTKKKLKSTDKAALKKAKALKGDKKVVAKKGKAEKPAKRKLRPGQFVYKAPADFKPHDLIIAFRTTKDGLLCNDFEAVRYLGRFGEEVDDRKKSIMSTYDMPTLLAIASRIGCVTFKPNAVNKYPEDIAERNSTEKVKNKNTGEKQVKLVFRKGMRLPAETTFRLLARVGRRSADNTLSATVKKVWQLGENRKGRAVYTELDKKDPASKLIRRVNRILPAAFQNVQMPPKKTRQSRRKDSDDE